MGWCLSKENHQQIDGPTATYLITIKTATGYRGASTDRKVTLSIEGQNGDATGYLNLHSLFKDNFEENQRDNFVIPAKDVGPPILIRIKLEGGHADDQWLCDYIIIGIQGQIKRVKFPVYDWIDKEITIMPGNATLPQHITNDRVKDARSREIELNKALFEWVPLPSTSDIGWGLPRYVNADSYNSLPAIFKQSIVREKFSKETKFESVLNLALSWMKTKTLWPLDSLESYKSLSEHEKLPSDDSMYCKNWQVDAVMGRQVLNGISPLVIARCNSLPEYFNVTNEDVCELLDGESLEQQMEAGKIYIGDYVPLIKDIERNPELICPNSCALFYAKNEHEFLPIAIQLVPGDRDYLFTADGSDDWLLAKMYFRCSMSSIHEWVYHFLYTHNITEPFAVALFRCFPKSHPLYKLLRPHLQTVSAINSDARTSLIPDDGPANSGMALRALDCSQKFFKDFKFDDIVIPKRLKSQGTDDPSKLPGYYYRDDALELWQIMEKYVKNVIGCFYKSDQDVKEDFELQDWMQDVAKNGLNWQNNNDQRFPDKVENIDDLVEICVTLMFTCSAQHAAVNFGQFETYKFAPNSPACMRMEPHKKGEGCMERILDSLPSAYQAGVIIAITYALSGYVADDDVFIGQFPDNLFCGGDVIEAQESYTEELEKFEAKIMERNEKLGLEMQYNFLLPGRVPRNIAI